MATEPTGVTTEQLLTQLLEEQKAQREEIAKLREENSKRNVPTPVSSSAPLSQEELQAQRMEEVAQHSHYCPACGNLVDYPQQCVGVFGSYGHAPTEVVPTTELTEGNPDQHTAAPFVTGEGAVVRP